MRRPIHHRRSDNMPHDESNALLFFCFLLTRTLQVHAGRSGRSRQQTLSPNFWQGTSMETATFWVAECEKLRANGIPVHACYVNRFNSEHVAQSFRQISERAGQGGVCQYLQESTNHAFLSDLLSSRILNSLGANQDEKEKLMTAYREKFPAPCSLH